MDESKDKSPLVVQGEPDRAAVEIWGEVLGRLRAQVTDANYQTWLHPTVGMSWDGKVFVVGCPSAFLAEQLEQRMYSLIAQQIGDVVKSRRRS